MIRFFLNWAIQLFNDKQKKLYIFLGSLADEVHSPHPTKLLGPTIRVLLLIHAKWKQMIWHSNSKPIKDRFRMRQWLKPKPKFGFYSDLLCVRAQFKELISWITFGGNHKCRSLIRLLLQGLTKINNNCHWR